MNGWSGKSKILCIEQSGRAEKNTRKQKFSLSSPSLCKYFPNIFLSPGYPKIFAAVFPRVCSTGPLTLSHPSARLSKFKLILVLLRWGFNSYQIFERKWNCQNMFTQIFLSEIISTAENGGQGTHFLISQILKGLTHSVLCTGDWLMKHCTIG